MFCPKPWGPVVPQSTLANFRPGPTSFRRPVPPANGSAVPVGGPGYEAFAAAMQFAYGVPSTQQGMGGAVPFVANLLEAFPDLEVLGVGAQDPLARIHAPNESIHLKELRDSIVAEAVFLQNLADS